MPASVKTFTDTASSLRHKAAEFLHLAAGARDPVALEELRNLAAFYIERAMELERVAQRARPRKHG